MHISSFVFIFSLVLCNSTPLLDNGSFERLAGSPNRRSEPAPRQQAGVPKSLKTSATVSGSLHRYKIAYDNTQQPVISLSFHVFKETPYLCSKAFFFLNTARIAIPNALMTNKEVNRPTFV